MSRRCVAALASWAPAVALFASTPLARADGDLEALLDQSVVTTASKSAETTSNAPATVTTLTAEDMRRFGIHSLAEAINFLSLGAITFDPLNTVDIGARGVVIKGDNGDHVLLLVDGHAVNEQLSGSARFDRAVGVPMELIDHVEVILGPGSVLYGSNAMLGVINVVTKRARDWSGIHVVGEAEIGKSARVSGGAGTTLNWWTTPTEVTFGIEYYKQDGPAFYFEPQLFGINDAYSNEPFRTRRGGPATGVWGGAKAYDSYYSEIPAGHLRVKQGAFELNLHASSFKRSSPYNSEFVNRNGDYDDPASYILERWLWGDLKYRATVSSVLEMTARVYGDTYDQQSRVNVSRRLTCRYDSVYTCSYREANLAQWVGSELQANFDWLGTGRFVTLLGADGRYRHVGAKQDQVDFDTGRYLRSSDGIVREKDAILGVYAQQTWQPWKALSLNGGGRFDFVAPFNPVLSPRLAVTANLWDGGTLKAVYAEAFRAPSWYEQRVASFDILQSENLQPERVRSAEASIEQRFGTQRIAMGAFRSEWRDLVEKHALTEAEMLRASAEGKVNLTRQIAVSQYQNVSSIDSYGFNGSYEGSLFAGSLRYGLNVTGAIARRLQALGESPLEVAPRLFGNARVLYDFPGDWPALGIAAQFKSNALTNRSLDGGFVPMPIAPSQLELRATVSGPLPIIAGLTYRASADYAFADKTPYIAGVHQNSGTKQRYFSYLPEFDKWYLAPVDTFRVTVGLQYDLLP